jgi:flagellar protein FlaG
MTVDTVVFPASAGVAPVGSVNKTHTETPSHADTANQDPAPIAAVHGPTAEQLQAAAEKIQSQLHGAGIAVDVRVDSKTERQIITVRDSANGNVIRQIPGDQALWLADHLGQGSSALLSETV